MSYQANIEKLGIIAFDFELCVDVSELKAVLLCRESKND